MDVRFTKVRFAPSPTGLLHLGSVRTALFNFLIARQARGVFLLRIEDTDAARGHEKYTQALQEDLRWLGLQWQEGAGVGGGSGPYLQSQRASLYERYFAELENQGLAYHCFCSQRELEMERKAQRAAGRPPRYSGRCRRLKHEEVAARLGAGTPATLRFHVKPGEVLEFADRLRGLQRYSSEDIGDFVIRRSDGTPAFFFSNAVDDALMGVTLAVRGEDHLTNTPRQMLILRALDLSVPDYAHIALVVGAGGAPLSKREGSRTIRGLRETGFLPLAINNYLARLGHSYDDNNLLTLDALAKGFDIARLHRAPARFDETQLMHWQREAVRLAPAGELWGWMREPVHALVPEGARDDFVEVLRPNLSFPPDALEWARVLYANESFALTGKARDIVLATPASYFDSFLELYERFHGDPKTLVGRELPARTGRKGAAAFQPLRAALTNKPRGPELARLLEIMPPDRVRKRIEYAKETASRGR
ncbi:MAG: glutamate--tRNA ligase [Gammaproteobacteria bacterium]|nr:MAG: glutamate--tRNA ligase [Gammaproteobacteria bacterium]